MGLSDGYETRSMSKDLVDFKVDLRPFPSYAEIPELTPPPPIPDGKSDNPIEPIRIWVDMNGDVIKGMWLKFVTAVISMVTGRPGIHTRELANMMRPGATLVEVEEAVGWLMKRGAISVKEDGGPAEGCWPTEGFYRALEGL